VAARPGFGVPGGARPPGRHRPTVRRVASWAAVAGAIGLVAIGITALATGSSGESGVLYFTTFHRTALYRTTFDFHAGRPQLGRQQRVTWLPGADGVVFEPDGHAVVGEQNRGTVAEVDPTTGAFRSVASGCPGAFLLTVDPTTDDVFTAGLPGPLCVMPVDPLRPGLVVDLHGDDTQVTSIAFDGSGRAYYTTGGSFGPGNFGVINVDSGTTTRELSDIAAGHGITYDAYSHTLFLFGGDTIMQIDPRHLQHPVSELTVPDVQIDQGTTDGHGHLFAASNYGQLVVVDYHLSGQLQSPQNRVTVLHLRNDLDDIAPLVGPGAAAAGGRQWLGTAAALLGVLFVAGLAGLGWPALRARSRLPSWDIRRREAERRPGLGRRGTRRAPPPAQPAPRKTRPRRSRPVRRRAR